jgi:hypothetical protein
VRADDRIVLEFDLHALSEPPVTISAGPDCIISITSVNTIGARRSNNMGTFEARVCLYIDRVTRLPRAVHVWLFKRSRQTAQEDEHTAEQLRV